MISSEIQVLAVLKGNTKAVAAKMVSQYRPHQGEQYLVFATYQRNEPRAAYNATEAYRIVPINPSCQISQLTTKPLVEQIRIVLRRRLDDLHRELELAAEEKKRLEQAVTK